VSVETSPPEVLREAAPGREATAAPIALAPSIDRCTAARLLASRAWPLSLRHRALGEALQAGSLRPVLVPAWSLDVEVRSIWSCGEERSGTRKQRCAGLVVPGVEGPAAGVVRAALCGEAQASAVPATDLSDWVPLSVSRPLASAWTAACAHLGEVAAEDAALGLSLDETERLSVETRFEEGGARALLVPAWKARVRIGSDEVSIFLEASTGRLVGRLPWNGRRLAAVAAAAGAFLGFVGVVLS
jgi:hypothetical protein